MATTPAIVAKTLGKVSLLLLVACCAPALAQGTEADRALMGLPGFDFSSLPTPAKKELATVLTDEFDFCGRPMTLLGSLKKGDACKHTRRMVGYAAILANDGLPATEIIVSLAKYNQSFSAKRTAFTVDERLCKGPKDAKVTLVEFSDFECPYCNLARPLLATALKKQPALRVCYLPFPLSGHENAIPAGQAALFARDNGKFWELHDALFDNQLTLSVPFIKQLAKKVGLDDAALAKVLAGTKYVDELNASKEQGKKAGVESTPAIYLNGRKLGLGLSETSLPLAVEDELDWVAGNNAWPGS